MIEILKKYYDISLQEYREYENGIVFFVDGVYYYFIKTIFDSKGILKCFEFAKKVKNKGVKIHDFVFNKNGELLSVNYVLFKVNVFIEEISINELSFFNKVIIDNDFDYVNMIDFWYKKIDYLEKQISELSNNSVINYSFDYFVGISELLLLYLQNNNYYNQKVLVHRTLNSLNALEFYNPLNLIIGDKYKDYISYIRLKNDWDLFLELIEKVDYNSLAYIFVRMCFPFHYFELVSDVLLKEKSEEELVFLLTNVSLYEKYLLKVSEACKINIFSWIKKE